MVTGTKDKAQTANSSSKPAGRLGLAQKAQILNSQGTKDIEERIERILTELTLAHNAMNGRRRDLDEAKERLAIEEARLLADAKGSNAEQRKAAALAARQEDDSYRIQEGAWKTALEASDEAIENYERLKRDLGVRMVILKLRTAQLAFLGSDI